MCDRQPPSSSATPLQQADRFPIDTETHVYREHSCVEEINGRPRSVLVHEFSPRSPIPDTTTLALVPGGSFASATCYYALAPRLLAARHGARFLFVDLPGTGGSGRDVADLDQAAHSDLMLSALANVADDHPLVLGGHSMGGAYAQVMARRRRLRPKGQPRIRALLLLDPLPLGGSGLLRTAWLLARSGPSAAGVTRRFFRTSLATADDIALVERVRSDGFKVSPRAALACLRGRGFPDATCPFTGPVLVLGAADSIAVRQNRLVAMAASAVYPRADYQRIDGGPAGLAGHCDFLDLPATAQACARFLRQIDEGGASTA
jgi:pimeloyl-ACP methyl ester carboxylesterase